MSEPLGAPRSVAEQRVSLMLDGFYVPRLDFERWRVANGRDPEWAASERQPLSTRCRCETCRAVEPSGTPTA